MRKALKIIRIVLLVIVVLLIAAPLLFKGTIEKQVKKAINNNVNANVEWAGLSLNLFSSFPNARLKLKDINVVNHAPFEGDTLVAGKTLFLDMGIPQLLKGGDKPLSINKLGLDEAYVNILTNEQGQANYDIAKESDQVDKESEGSDLSLDVQHYEINKSRINYLDESSKMFLRIQDFNHKGAGDFSAKTSTLKTKTNALVSFTMDTTRYLNKNKIDLDADIKMDLEEMKFSFEDNKMLLNQLPLEFEGYVQVNDDNQEMDIAFATPSSDFKNFLGVIPEDYAKNLDQVETDGKFSVAGKIFGVNDDDHIPMLDIAMKSEDAYFKYPDLPKAVEHINFDVVLKNETGLMEDMNLDMHELTFKIDQDVFSADGSFKNLTENMLVDLTVKGRLNLANIDQAYPVEMDMDLDGVLDADLSASFEMDDIEHENYEAISTEGSASLKEFSYTSEEIPNPIKIDRAGLKFDPGNIELEEFVMKTGETDANLTGKLENLMGFLFKNQPVKGDFQLTSNTFSVNDFMVKPTEDEEEKEQSKGEKSKGEEEIKIPSFLDIALSVEADKVLYDNLTLTDLSGSLAIQDETASLNDITAHIFGGIIGLNGNVATKGDTPKFAVDLSLQEVDILKSVEDMELMQNFAPIAKALTGNLNTSIKLNGDLTKDLLPVYATLTGEGMAELVKASVQKDKMPLVSNLNDKLNFIDFDKLDDIKDLTTHFEFEDGGINFEPFEFDLKSDIKASVSGKHTFDNQMDYTLNLDLPAKYLGSDLSSGLAKLSKSELEDTTIEVPVGLKGSFSKPKIDLNLKRAVKDLTDKIVDEQKEDLKEKGKEKLKGLLNRKKESDEEDSDKEEEKQDTSKAKEDTKKKAEKALKGLFGDKKKKDKKEEEKEEEGKEGK